MMTPVAPPAEPHLDHVPRISDRDVCLRCLAHQCELVCPTGCYATRPDGRMTLDLSRCLSCRACVVICYEFDNIAWHSGASTRD